IWSVLATDVEFGMDGGLYVLDWTEGWYKPNKGRIYKIISRQHVQDAGVQQVRKLMAEGLSMRSTGDLIALLHHADTRVRQEAQFTLAERSQEASAALLRVLQADANQLTRLHALWALGQIARRQPTTAQTLIEAFSHLSNDPDAEVRGQIAKVIGECRMGA